jgi:hypothetical protein
MASEKTADRIEADRAAADLLSETVERGRALIKLEQSTAFTEKESYAWSPQFRDDLSCVFCGRTERTVLTSSRPGARAGLCEACCVNAAWSWRGLPGDAPALPAKVERPTRIKVLLPRIKKTGDGSTSPSPSISISYEFALVKIPPVVDEKPSPKSARSGAAPEDARPAAPEPAAPESPVLPDRDDVTRESQINDLPGVKLGENENEVAAVGRALDAVGIGTWPMFCEPLCSGYTPRGNFARIYLVTAWYRRSTTLEEDQRPGGQRFETIVWRAGCVHDNAPEMAGLYLTLREVWPLRVWKHAAKLAERSRPETLLSAVSVQLSRGAVEYIRTQAAVRAGDREVDTSMAEILYKRMTADEKAVDKLIRAEAAARSDLAVQKEAEQRAATAVADAAAAASEDELPDDLGDPDDADEVDGVTGPPRMTEVNGTPPGDDVDE